MLSQHLHSLSCSERGDFCLYCCFELLLFVEVSVNGALSLWSSSLWDSASLSLRFTVGSGVMDHSAAAFSSKTS